MESIVLRYFPITLNPCSIYSFKIYFFLIYVNYLQKQLAINTQLYYNELVPYKERYRNENLSNFTR